MWKDQRLLSLFGIDIPIIQAPMAGANGSQMAAEVSAAGGLGSLPCAMLGADKIRSEVAAIRNRTDQPFNLNFFCHTPPRSDAKRNEAWLSHLAPYYAELGLDQDMSMPRAGLAPFNSDTCAVVGELRPKVVSFHFGLPAQHLLDQVKDVGCKVISSATTVAEAVWLADHGCDAIIAQGYEAGGHRGMFLSADTSTQVGTMALVPQIVDAVDLPVIAAGGISDGRGIVAALALGASGVQVGTAFLFTPEALISDIHRQALSSTPDSGTTLTRVLTGRPARGIVNRVIRELEPVADEPPAFPLAASPLAPLRTQAEKNGSGDFSPLWSGQAAGLASSIGARALTVHLAEQAQQTMRRLSEAGTN